MTPEEILEGNKLIAEFMGYGYHPHMEGETLPGWRKEKAHPKISGTYLARVHKDLAYHRSWEWLMTAVEKIESLDLSEEMYSWKGIEGETEYNFDGVSVEIENKSCWIYVNLQLDPMFTINTKTLNVEHPTKIEATFRAVCEFIEWFNKRKEVEETEE
jgi:hypothetical protein